MTGKTIRFPEKGVMFLADNVYQAWNTPTLQRKKINGKVHVAYAVSPKEAAAMRVGKKLREAGLRVAVRVEDSKSGKFWTVWVQ